MLVLKEISKAYGDHHVLKNIDLEIVPGDFVFLVGPSGVGKSTLLHLLIGAELPTSGQIKIDDIALDAMDEHSLQLYRRKIGMVFQDFKLLPKKTVFENVAFALEATDIDPTEIPEQVMSALSKVGLSGKEDAFPRELSGGEQQRVAIARAIVRKPNLLIADEPTGNLDPRTSQEIINLLKKLHVDEQVTIIIATHDRSIVNHLRERVIELSQQGIVRDEENAFYY